MKIHKKTLVELLVILILGLTPLLWFHGNQIISGHDSGLPLSPVVHFVDRLNIWTQRIGFGFDQSIFIPGFFIHGIEALVTSLGASLQLEQKITFIIWFVLPGLTMYYLASKIARKCELRFFALPVSLLYMFNHFLLQGWFIAERTKFSLYIALPLLLAWLFDWEEKKISSLRAGLFISLTFFVFNGEGNIPLFGGVLVLLVVYTFFYFLNTGFTWNTIKRFISLVVITLFASIFLNMYWLLPYMHFVSTSYQSQVMQAGGVSGVVGWLDYISQYGSLINLFRLQGIPDWYLNLKHPYAGVFLNNTLLVFISYLIPIIAFLPLLLYKKVTQRKLILFFSFLALFSMIFIAGSHPPFGAFYMLLIKIIPGFIAFRTPFYKFAPALWFAYALLIGFCISYFLQMIEKKKIIVYTIYISICIAILGYNYPFFTGQFFDYITGERTMKVTVPPYIFQFGAWSMTPQRKDIRTLALPNSDNGSNTFIDEYSWGYWSPTPITSLLTNASIINLCPYMSPNESNLLSDLYLSMEDNKPDWEKLARALGIQSFLVRKDFVPNDKGSQAEDPKTYENAMHSPELKLVKKFGQWEVYDFIDTTKEGKKLTINHTLAYINGTTKDIGSLASLPFFSPNDAFYISGSTPNVDEHLLQIANKIYTVSDCISCNLTFPLINLDSYAPVLIRKSIFYSLFNKKSKQLPNFHDALYESLTNVMAFKKVMDEKRDINVVISTINDYENSLDVLYKVTQSYLKDNNNTADINASLIDAINVIRNEKRVFSDKFDILSENAIYGISADTYKKLQTIEDIIDKNVWYTTDEEHKRFLVQVPRTGTYNLLYLPDISSVSNQKVTFSMDGTSSTVSATQQGESWLSLGSISLTMGQHLLEVEQPINAIYSVPSKQLVTAAAGSCYYLGSNKRRKE